MWSKSLGNGSDVHVNFVDWLPFIFSTLGMIIINSVEKARLSADSYSYSGNGVAWQARVVLFLGFAALAGGMAGGVCIFVLKYVVPGVGMPMMTMGIENVIANGLIGLRYCLPLPHLWSAGRGRGTTRRGLTVGLFPRTQLGRALGQPEHGRRVRLQPRSVKPLRNPKPVLLFSRD